MASDEDLRLRQLDHIQGVISRLAQNSFTVRGWSVSLVSVVLAVLGARDGTAGLAALALVPALVFWGLDAYYLRQERLYRRLYAEVARRVVHGPPAAPDPAPLDLAPFDMDSRRFRAAVPSFGRTLVTPSVVTIPALLVLGVVGYELIRTVAG